MTTLDRAGGQGVSADERVGLDLAKSSAAVDIFIRKVDG